MKDEQNIPRQRGTSDWEQEAEEDKYRSQPKQEMTSGTFLVALFIICLTIISIVQIIWG